jgi:hypothetical protein
VNSLFAAAKRELTHLAPIFSVPKFKPSTVAAA